jgi:hypothetical protein
MQMSQPFEFPPAPTGHYFQIKYGLEDHFDAPRWRVVLMRKRWIFPIEVSGQPLKHLTPADVYVAAEQAAKNFQLQRESRQLDHQRKQLNRNSQRSNK